MVDALCTELKLRRNDWQEEIFETIYFGGGTPSVLKKHELERLIEQVKTQYRVSDPVEITLECNPDDCSIENLTQWKALGVTRLSIGIQSFNDKQLEWMNRTHQAADSLNAVLHAKEVGFDELSLDLMYGLPDMTLEEWKDRPAQVEVARADLVAAVQRMLAQ